MWIVAALFVALIFLVLRQTVVMLTPESIVAVPDANIDDELILIGGHSLLLKHGSLGNRIAHWTHAGNKNSRAFEVGDTFFTPASADLTREGSQKVATFAQLMNAAPQLKARIFASGYETDAGLTQLRMRRLREGLIANAVTPARITVSKEPIAGGAQLAANRPEVVLILAK